MLQFEVKKNLLIKIVERKNVSDQKVKFWLGIKHDTVFCWRITSYLVDITSYLVDISHHITWCMTTCTITRNIKNSTKLHHKTKYYTTARHNWIYSWNYQIGLWWTKLRGTEAIIGIVNIVNPNLLHILFTKSSITTQYNTIQCKKLHYTTLHYTTLHYATLHCTTLPYSILHYTTLHYTTLHTYVMCEWG